MNRDRESRATPARLLAALALGLGIIFAAGCDLQENADTARGRQLFVAKCGTCHALAEAATTATVGPNLDAAFAESRASGMDQDTIEGVTESQIANPRTVAADDPTFMPANLVTGDDAADVAAYVASVAGVPGIQPPKAPGGPGGQVFANNGCGACHTFKAAMSSGTAGPDLDEVLAGQSPDQIEKSILDPDSVITPGFDPGVMPSTFGESIDAKDLMLLVEFLMGG